MFGRSFGPKVALLRWGALAGVALAVAACQPVVETTLETEQVDRKRTVLPAGTAVIYAPDERGAQLRTGTWRDDIPEYTGAPGPDGKWPAYAHAKRRTVYRDEDVVTGQ